MNSIKLSIFLLALFFVMISYRTLSANAIVYQHCNFGGYHATLGAGPHTLGQLVQKGIRNDDISSIRVSPGYEAILFEHDNFAGKSWTIRGDKECFTSIPGLNDVVSSILVRRVGQTSQSSRNRNHGERGAEQTVKLFQDCNYGGRNISLQPGGYLAGQLFRKGMEDNISSIKVPAGYQAELYESNNYTGRRWVITGNRACFSSTPGLNDAVSSIIIKRSADN